MRLVKIIFFYCLCSFFISTAQVDTLFFDDFSDNTNNWQNTFSKDFNCYIKNNQYKIQYFPQSGNRFIARRFEKLDPNKDFYIETTFSLEGFTSTTTFGFFLEDYRNPVSTNRYYYQFNPAGQFAIYHYDVNNTKTNIYNNWTNDVNLSPGIKKENRIAIRKVDEQTYFYINNKVVHVESKPFTGSGFGFFINNQITINFDYLLVKQDVEKINLAKGTENISYTLKRLDDRINSEYGDLGPIVTADGKTLYIFRKNHPGNIKKGRDDVWVSTKNDSVWSEMKNIGKPINNEGNNFVVSVSADGNTLYLANTYTKKGAPKGGGLSVAKRKRKGWSVPVEVMIDEYVNYNKFVNYCLSHDENVLIMAIEKEDTYGDRDLYVSFKIDKNKFSKPINMGSSVNSYAEEGCPFLAVDGKTLYYVSAGKPGYGGLDIFVTRRLDSTWLNWSEPENLGPGINTQYSEAYYSLPASGDYAYLVARGTKPNDGGDVYIVKLSDPIKPEPVVIVKGKVINKKNNQAVSAEINCINLSNNEVVATTSTDIQTGDFQLVLPAQGQYGIKAHKDGFYGETEFVNLSENTEYQYLDKDLYIVQHQVGNSVVLKNLFFEYDKADLLTKSYAELDLMALYLKQHPSMEVEIAGHTDNVGSDTHNKALSEQRAISVLTYLQSKGVNNKMKAVGYGKSKPIATNDTEEGRAMNRRVEFTILKK